MRRVVVTGLGIVSPLGRGVDYNWKSILEGKSGIRSITGNLFWKVSQVFVKSKILI